LNGAQAHRMARAMLRVTPVLSRVDVGVHFDLAPCTRPHRKGSRASLPCNLTRTTGGGTYRRAPLPSVWVPAPSPCQRVSTRFAPRERTRRSRRFRHLPVPVPLPEEGVVSSYRL